MFINFLKIQIILLLSFGYINVARALDFPLLKVTKNEHSVWLIGSLHTGVPQVSRANDLDFLVKKSHAICFENDPKDIQNNKRAAEIFFLNQEDEDLKTRLGSKIYLDSKKNLDWYLSNGNSIDDMSAYAIANLLTMKIPNFRDFQLKLKPDTSIDSDIQNAASRYNKNIFAIESANAVPDAFLKVSDKEWQYYVAGMIKILTCTSCSSNYSKNMIAAFDISDDFEAAYNRSKQAFSSDPKIFSIFEKIYFGQRNIDIAKNIEAEAVDKNKCDIVAIGAGHLGGKNGVVNLLKQNGLKIESVQSIR